MSTAAQREACRRATAARMRGNLHAAMHGRARRVDEQSMAAYSVELGRRIHLIRTEQDIPLNELAEATGISIQALSHIERGINPRRSGPSNPHYLTIARIALALGVSPSELMP